MVTTLAIVLLIAFAGLVVIMALTPVIVESEARKPPAPYRLVDTGRSEDVSREWEHHQHAA